MSVILFVIYLCISGESVSSSDLWRRRIHPIERVERSLSPQMPVNIDSVISPPQNVINISSSSQKSHDIIILWCQDHPECGSDIWVLCSVGVTQESLRSHQSVVSPRRVRSDVSSAAWWSQLLQSSSCVWWNITLRDQTRIRINLCFGFPTALDCSLDTDH